MHVLSPWVFLVLYSSIVSQWAYADINFRKVPQHSAEIRQTLGLNSDDHLKVIVIGGGSGIGEGFVKYLARMKSDILIASRACAGEQAPKLNEFASSHSSSVISRCVDFADEESIQTFLDEPELQSHFDGAHIVVYAAGLNIYDVLDTTAKLVADPLGVGEFLGLYGGREEERQRAQIEDMLRIKGESAELFLEAMAARMKARSKKSGHLAGILLPISSLGGVVKFVYPLKNYHISNRRLIEITQDIGQRYAGDVLAYAVAPGAVDTPMAQQFGAPSAVVKQFGYSAEELAQITIAGILSPEKHAMEHIKPHVFVPGFKGLAAYASGKVNLPGWNLAVNVSPLLRAQVYLCSKLMEGVGELFSPRKRRSRD